MTLNTIQHIAINCFDKDAVLHLEPGPLERKGLLWYPFLNWVGYAHLVLLPAKGGGLA